MSQLKVVAVMSGGFIIAWGGVLAQKSYDWAVSTFGAQNVYVAPTNDTTTRPS